MHKLLKLKMCFQEDIDDNCASTEFLQMQKNQLIDLQENLKRYCNVLPVFGFNSAKYHIILIKSYFLPMLINIQDFEPVVKGKANQYISVSFW